MHRWPGPQTAFPPHLHTPLLHDFARTGSHTSHAAPPIPQLPKSSPPMQMLFEQQPSGQDVLSHTQAPPTQRCPSMHGPFAPHWHAPVVEHVSARIGSHATHALLLTPHVATEAVLQVFPEQQPPGQVAGLQLLHTPPVQAPPPGHA